MTSPVTNAELAASVGVSEPAESSLLTIGELSEQTGLSPSCSGTWESRFGFPVPTRLPSGHRRYTDVDVRVVRRILEERERGLRLEQAVAAAQRAEDVSRRDPRTPRSACATRS